MCNIFENIFGVFALISTNMSTGFWKIICWIFSLSFSNIFRDLLTAISRKYRQKGGLYNIAYGTSKLTVRREVMYICIISGLWFYFIL